MVLPTFASVPLLAIYSGATEVVVPVILRPYLGNTLELSNSLHIIIRLMTFWQLQATFTMFIWACSLFSARTQSTFTLD